MSKKLINGGQELKTKFKEEPKWVNDYNTHPPIKKKPDYFNKKLKKVSKKELLKSIAKVEEENKRIDAKRKFHTYDLLVRAGS